MDGGRAWGFVPDRVGPTRFREGEDLEALLRSGQSSLARRLHAATRERPAYAHQREPC